MSSLQSQTDFLSSRDFDASYLTVRKWILDKDRGYALCALTAINSLSITPRKWLTLTALDRYAFLMLAAFAAEQFFGFYNNEDDVVENKKKDKKNKKKKSSAPKKFKSIHDPTEISLDMYHKAQKIARKNGIDGSLVAKRIAGLAIKPQPERFTEEEEDEYDDVIENCLDSLHQQWLRERVASAAKAEEESIN
jgi:hypothetical protein